MDGERAPALSMQATNGNGNKRKGSRPAPPRPAPPTLYGRCMLGLARRRCKKMATCSSAGMVVKRTPTSTSSV